MNTINMKLQPMLLIMQIYDELKDNFLFYSIERTIFQRYPVGEATNYFRFMTPSVDESTSNELMTQRSIASLTDAA